MLSNAQLYKDKTALVFQVESLKDRYVSVSSPWPRTWPLFLSLRASHGMTLKGSECTITIVWMVVVKENKAAYFG